MDQDFKEFVDRCFEVSARKEDISRDDIIRMLGVSPDSEECGYLGSRARELAAIKSKNKATLGTPFGVDYVPCDASCRFCSFGTKWGLMEGQSYHIPVEDIIAMMKERMAAGYTGFTIRTTEFYPVDRLCEMARRIREEVPGDYKLGVNTGELTVEDCVRLKEAGYNSAYHTLHLREGIDTPFPPERRLRTMRAISESPLNLTCGVDPIGIEHTDEEIADIICTLRSFDPASICSMKRINAKGTPVGDLEEVSDRRIAQIAAIIRFASHRNVSAVPPSKIAMQWGASGTSIGTGANPRDSIHDPSTVGRWRFDHDKVRQDFLDCGYTF